MRRRTARAPATFPLLAALAAFLVAFAACGEFTGPIIGPPADLSPTTGDAQADTVGQRLGDTLVVRVVDENGHAVEGAAVAWAVVGDGGSVAPALDSTDIDGFARAVWTLGTKAGEQAVEASVDGLTTRFGATSLPDAPARFTAAAGEDQIGTVGVPLPDRLVVRVADAYDNPVPDRAIEWTFEGEGGAVAPASFATDDDGRADAAWTLGPTAGAQSVRATIDGLTLVFTATALAGDPARLVLLSGDNQEAPAGERLADTLAVRLHDAFDNPVADAPVAWSVTAGGGSILVLDAATDEEGAARALWTLGVDAEQAAEAVVGSFRVAFAAVLDGCDLSDPDADGDRLPDCAETATGRFVGWWDAGTDPADADTDGDGLPDGDEALGSLARLDLPALGVSPVHKDILLEYDWFEDSNDCDFHSHRPSSSALAAVSEMFAGAPVDNPDGTTGVRLIHDFGQGGVFTGGNRIEDEDGLILGHVYGSEYGGYRTEEMAPERRGYFHYVLLPHRYGDAENGSSGNASLSGDRVIVSLQCQGDHDPYVANTVAHELGHNLSLRHGGRETTNWKPNYNSVMNYAYQFAGADVDCAKGGDGRLDYSHGSRPPLDENALEEAHGVCGAAGPAWDWNGDGDGADSAVAADINVDGSGTGDGLLTVLADHDDWAALFFAGPAAGADAAAFLADPEPPTCMPTPEPDEWPRPAPRPTP